MAQPTTLEEALQAIEVQNTRIAALEAKAAAKVTSTSITVDAKKVVHTVPSEPVSVDGKEYKFTVAKFRLPGHTEVLISEEVALDNDIIADILKIDGQSILKLQA